LVEKMDTEDYNSDMEFDTNERSSF
jgi:hypothetical protein